MCEDTDSRWATTVAARGTRLRISGVSRFLCLLSLRHAKKVGAAPHRGNANRPPRIQGEAQTPGIPKKSPRHRQKKPQREPQKTHFRKESKSITNRYLTSLFSIRSYASLIPCIGITSISEVIPCSPQKSNISCVSAIPPISDPASRRRLKIRLNTCGDG